MYKIRIDNNTANDVVIKSPISLDDPAVKIETIEKTNSINHVRYTYPNGFVCEAIADIKGVEIISNCPIIFDGFSGFHFDFSKIDQ